MKRILFLGMLTALVISMTGCATMRPQTSTTYDISLSSVKSPKDATIRYGETKIIPTTEEDGTSKYIYEDDYMKIMWVVSTLMFHFDIENKTDFSIKIPWDEVTYVDAKGQASRVIHGGIKYIDKNEPQLATVIPAHSSFSDIIMPADNIKYYEYLGWREYSLFGTYSTQETADASSSIGKTIRLLFPIIIQNVTNEYTFEFVLNGMTVK